jgi:thioredoxin reductase (NADPH)
MGEAYHLGMASESLALSHEVALIGAGPIGLEVAVALKAASVDYVQFEAAQVGQTIYAFPPATRFYSSNERIAIAGMPLQTIDQGKCTREAYLCYLRTVVQQFDLSIRSYEPVEAIDRIGGEFQLRTRTLAGVSNQWRIGKIILATGGTSRARQLGIPGESLPHVHHVFADPHVYFRKRVLVVGGRNSAVEAALRCHHAGARVAISYRREGFDPTHIKYWLLPEINSLIELGHVEAHFGTIPESIAPMQVTLRAIETEQRVEVAADFVLLQIGYVADMSLCRMAGVELSSDQQVPVFNPATMETNISGIYVAGTAIAGTQEHYRVFMENCHGHAGRIVAAIQGDVAKVTAEQVHGRSET